MPSNVDQPTREHVVRQAARRTPAALRRRAAEAARRGRRQLAMLVPVLAGLLVAYAYRKELFGVDKPVRIAVAAVLILLGWAVARNVGRLAQPRLEQRLEPGTAGILGFVVQLTTLAVAALVSLRLAGLQPGALAAGAGFTAIVLGLATQQTFGNIFAGVVLLSARPFQVGDRVRFAGFGMDVEGTVAAHGLLHVTLYDGDDQVLIPNNTVLSMSARPINEPDAVDMRARLPLTVDPEAVQRRVDEAVGVPTKGPPHVALEELNADDVIVRVRATPKSSADGGRLAHDVLQAVAGFRDGSGGPEPRRPAGTSGD
jgi:small conductance mechanosensitive channel